MKSKRLLAGPYLFWSVSFVVIPLLVIVYYAFTNDEGGFTFSNLAQITTAENLKALGLSILLSLVSTVVCLLLAYPLAMILSPKKVMQKYSGGPKVCATRAIAGEANRQISAGSPQRKPRAFRSISFYLRS